jgi:hypothetical protein
MIIGCDVTITHLSPEELDVSRIPALAQKGADINNPTTFHQISQGQEGLPEATWVMTLPCGTEYLMSPTATAQEYATIGGASTLVVYMRSEYLPSVMVHAFQDLLSAGKTIWLVKRASFTTNQRPLIFMLYRLCELPKDGEWSYVCIEFPNEDEAYVFIYPNGDPQFVDKESANA